MLEPIERGVDRTGRHVSLQAMLDFLQNGPAVALPPEWRPRMDESDQDGLFERTQVLRHVVYIVGNMPDGTQVTPA